MFLCYGKFLRGKVFKMLEKSNKSYLKNFVPEMLFFALFAVIFNAIFKKFGTFASYSSGRFSHLEMLGIIIPLILLILPILKTEHRKDCWSKKNIVLIFAVLIISIILISIIFLYFV